MQTRPASCAAAPGPLPQQSCSTDSNSHVLCAGPVCLQDGQSFLHVNYYSTGSVSWKSVGLLLATSLEDARRTSQSRQLPPGFGNQTRSRFASLQGSNRRTSSSALDSANSSRNTRGRMLLAAPTPRAGAGAEPRAGAGAEGLQEGGPRYNYVLAANRESLVGHIQRLGAVAGPTGCLIYLQDNVTLSKPPVPAAGIPVARPLAIVGLSRWVTSIDFYMQVRYWLLWVAGCYWVEDTHISYHAWRCRRSSSQ